MKKRYLGAGVPAILALAITAQGAATTWTWTGADSTDWNDSLNWVNTSSANGKPTTGDTIILTGQGSYLPTNQNISGLSVLNVDIDGTLPTGFTLTGLPWTVSNASPSTTAGLTTMGATLNATMAAGANNTITLSMADAAKIAVGDAITYTNGIQAGTTVTAVDTGTGVVTLSQSTTAASTAKTLALNFAAPTTWNTDLTLGGIFNGPASMTLGSTVGGHTITLGANTTWEAFTAFGVLTVNDNIDIGSHNLSFLGGQSFVGCGSMININGNITGTGTLTMSSSGNKMVALNGNNSGFIGSILLTRGAVSINSDAALGAASNGIVAGNNQAPEIDFTGNNFTVNSARQITLNTSGLLLNAQLGQTYKIDSVISDSISSGFGRVGSGANNSLTVAQKGGTIILAGQNTFSGGIVLSAVSEIGVTSDAGFGAVPTSVQANNIYFNSSYIAAAKLYLPNSMTINANRGIGMGGTSAGTGNTVTSLDTIDVDTGATVNYAGTLTNNDTAHVWINHLQKIGAGTFVLSQGGVGSYSGNTYVGGGTLLINGTLDNSGTSVYTASTTTGGTFGILGGNGTINRPVVMVRSAASGLAPGAGGIGSVGTLTVGNFSILVGTAANAPSWYIDLSGSSSDQLNINGSFTFAAGTGTYPNQLDINLNSLGSISGGDYTLATWTGTGPLAKISQYVLNYGNTGLNSGTASLSYVGNSLVLTTAAVPEPASFGLLAFASVGLMKRRRREQKA